MTEIIEPLDNILEIIKEITATNSTNRRGSNLETTYNKIITNVNEAKNSIIKFLLHDKNSENAKLKSALQTQSINFDNERPLKKTYSEVSKSIQK